MEKDIVIYHGSQQIVNKPCLKIGKKYNDYGQGFYCTESNELAKEWACPLKNDGYSNKYILHMDNLKVMYLTKEPFCVLNWLAILLENRKFDINNNVGNNARTYVLEHFLPDVSDVDVIIGYRADDSYFSFAEDFINNAISVKDLNVAMQLGSLGEQVVLVSDRAFEQLEYIGYEIADYREYYYKRAKRDEQARTAYKSRKKNVQILKDDIFVLDIIREEMRKDDPRLQSHIFK